MSMSRLIARHPWRMRRWLVHPRNVFNILKREREAKEYEAREGHPFYGPIPPDSWPHPIPPGFGHIFRCIRCGKLGYHGSETTVGDQGCVGCGATTGVIVGHFGVFPPHKRGPEKG